MEQEALFLPHWTDQQQARLSFLLDEGKATIAYWNSDAWCVGPMMRMTEPKRKRIEMAKLSFTRNQILETLATKYVGDDASDLSFVSYGGMVVAVFSGDWGNALDFAEELDRTDPETPIIVEDNTGVCWSNDADDRAQKEED